MMNQCWDILLICVVMLIPVIIATVNEDENPYRGHHELHEVLLENPITSTSFQDDITIPNLMVNLAALQGIADANGGNRAFGYPGYVASLDFVRSKLEQFSNTSTVWTQDFSNLFNEVQSISFSANGVEYFVHGLSFSPSTPPSGLSAQLVLGVTGDAGCTVDGYSGQDVRGKIVLVERGACPTGGTLAGRLKPAAQAGAAAVIIYNDVPDHITYGTLTAPDRDHFVPGGFVDQADGWKLRDMLEGGEEVEAYFQQTQLIENRTSWNLFAETIGGDPDNVIMLGAHLDSVLAGPGINDNGSGVTLLLELFIALQKYTTKNKIRFAFWGAEESGMAGSTHYVSSLSSLSASQILLYLNFDMVGQGFYGVFDSDGSTFGAQMAGPPGSGVIERLFVEELERQGHVVVPLPLNRGSDYKSFMDGIGKPVGGLHSGTGKEQDKCYHLACDTYANVDPAMMGVMAKTAAHVLAVLGMEADTLVFKTELTARNDTLPINGSLSWSDFGLEQHSAHCGHDY